MRTRLPAEYETLRNQKILVTGAAGFIGGALFRRLAKYDLDVVGTVLNEGEAETLKRDGFKAEKLNLASDDDWLNLLTGVDIVFNVAALFQEVEYGRSMYEKVNYEGTLRLFETAVEARVKRFVHCSTVGVHGHVKEMPCKETSPYNPMDEYHETKLLGELAILERAKALDPDRIVVTVNRPSMVYGPGDMRMYKLFKMIADRKFIMVGKGDTFAHLGFIEDQVESFLLQAVAPSQDVHLQAFNIASGDPIRLNELAQLIADACGVTLSRFHLPVKPIWFAAWICESICRPLGIKPPLFRRRIGFFTHDRAFDISKARSTLGYSPQWDEAEGVIDTVAWYRDRGLLPGKSSSNQHG